MPYAQQAAKDALSIKDTASYVSALGVIANTNSQVDKSDANIQKSIDYLELMLSARYKKFVIDFTRARQLGNLADLYAQIKNDQKAIVALNESMALARKGGNKSLLKHDLNSLMNLNLNDNIGDLKKAVAYGEQALAIEPEEQSNITMQTNIYHNTSDAYAGVGDYKNAFKYARMFKRLDDSINRAETAGEANELDKKYQADKRLIIAANYTRLAEVQRNYTVTIAVIFLIATVIGYRWFVLKKRREAHLMTEEHRQLAKLDALKTRFFANISHELRTPLTLILGPADQLLNNTNSDKEQQKKHLTTISRNSKRLLNMVNELLDLGKLESGKVTLKLKPIALARFIKVMYQSFYSAAEYKKINYRLICDIEDEIAAQIDEDKLEKIFNNLISNAIKFTPLSGSVTITAHIANTHIQLSVANTGGGIHPDDLPRIFERYYQGRREDQALQGGTGIGLAITREFVELMGGHISVDNTWNAGSAFHVNLPFIAAEIIDDAVAPASAAEEPGTEPDVVADSRAVILLVEDHHEMAGYIKAVLSPFYTLVTALNGTEALAVLQAAPVLPSLIISDVMMPGMDGFSLLEKLKQSLAFCNIPVIMLTALADNENRLKALHTGVDDYLTKPFLGNELVARATNLMNNAAARAVTTVQDMEELDDSESQELKGGLSFTSPADLAWLAEIEALVRKQVGKTDLNLVSLSYDLAVSERQLFRRIKSITGLTPNKYIRAIRLQIAREAIESGKYRTVAEISYVAGFDTPAYFSKLFKEQYGRDVNELL
jgi:signal transduction histidine kinase/DNA-binding response OmpR family regulator